MKTVLSVKTDRDVKKQAQMLAAELGLPLSTVVNASLKEFVRARAITFSAVPRMTKRLEKILGRVEKDLKTGKNLSPEFRSAEEAMRYLDAP